LKDGKEYANPAWAHSESIRGEMAKATSATRLLASLPNFEAAYLGEEVKSDKPYNILCCLKKESAPIAKLSQLLDALTDFTKAVPAGAVQWTSTDQLRNMLEEKA